MKRTKDSLENLGSTEFRWTGSEPRSGFISGNTFDRKEVKYSVIDSLAIFEGDIILGGSREMELSSSDLQERPVVISGQKYRWPSGVVPYTIESTLPDQNRITEAIHHWEQQTPIRFIERSGANASSYPNYIHFDRGDGCASYVGMQGGKQIITFCDGCSTGNATHEVGHAVGLWHEQSREDRDSFVKIVWENIDPNAQHNFNQHITDGDDVASYDYCSIMHYPPTAFSINDEPTIVPLASETVDCMGQRSELSQEDVAAVVQIYSSIVILSSGSNGTHVGFLQRILSKLNYPPGPIDGIFGNKTKAAVMRFQQENQLVTDGIVGPKTWSALVSALRSQ